MGIDYSFIHKILKDSTRRDILRYLNDEPLTYVELMKLSKVTNTGRFNYHLKVLGGLIEKMADGRYRLTERGQLAVQLLEKFPEKNMKIDGQPAVGVSDIPTLARSRKREFILMTVAIILANGAIWLLFFGVIFLRSPWPYGPFSLKSLIGIILGLSFVFLTVIVRRKYLRERNKNKNLSNTKI
jgi:DNA-binding transcriptional ArsR family regulator